MHILVPPLYFYQMYKNIKLGRGKGYRVEQGHPWIYNNEIECIDEGVENGELVNVFNFKNQFIGCAYFNAHSQISARILTRHQQTIDEDFFEQRIRLARTQREALGYTSNYRLVFGEADQLPGLIIDKFGDYFVLQILTLGMEPWKQCITRILQKIFFPKGIYERNDVPVRTLEGLHEQKGFLSKPFDTRIKIVEDNIRFCLDLAEGQKTGFFLDQKENRRVLQNICRNADVIDCFTYTGSFALYAAHYGATSICAYDVSEWAVKQANENALLNKYNQCSFECANAFDILPEKIKNGDQYDIVILDPPAFTKSRKNIHSAMRGYKEINLRGLKLTRSNGFLMTYSCSHFISDELFFHTLREAAHDAGRLIKRVQYLQQAKDHPALFDVPETQYLKGYLVIVE